MSGSNYTVQLGGNTVNVEAGTLDLTNQIGQRSQGSMTVWSATGVTYPYGTSVRVTDAGGALVYTGFVVEDRISKPGYAGTLEHDLMLVDNHYLADKRLVYESWLNESADVIVKAIWQNYLEPEGVTLGPIASGLWIPEYVSNYESAAAQLDKLATMCGYWWQIDANRALWFQPYGALAAPWVLDGTQADQTKNLIVTVGNKDYRNRQFGVGGKDHTGVLTETFTGDGKRMTYTLRYPVASLSGHDSKSGLTKGVYVNNILQTNVANKSSGNEAEWTYAISDAVVAQNSAYTLLTASDTLKVIYEGEYPVVALAQDASLISQQRALEGIGTGYVEARYSNLKVHTLGAMFTIAQAQLQHYGQSMTTLEFATLTPGLTQGQTLLVDLPDFSLSNTSMLIESVEITDRVDGVNIWYVVQAVGSPYDVAQWQTFWAGLLAQDNAADTLADNQSSSAALALLTQSTAAWNWTAAGSVTTSSVVCPICNTTTTCGAAVYVC